MKKIILFVIISLCMNTKLSAQSKNLDSLRYEFQRALKYHCNNRRLPKDSILVCNLINIDKQDVSLIKPYKNLRYLYGINETFPLEYMCSLKQLRELGILSERPIPDCLGDIQSLTFLDLFLSKYKKLPEFIGKLKNLVILKLSLLRLRKSDNNLEILKDLPHLKSLMLLLPSYRAYPNVVFELTQLKELFIECGKYLVLPIEILKLEQLEVLDVALDIADIRNLKTLSKMKNLKILTLSMARLKEIPFDLSMLSFLEKLIITSDLNREQRSKIRKLLPNTKVIFTIP